MGKLAELALAIESGGAQAPTATPEQEFLIRNGLPIVTTDPPPFGGPVPAPLPLNKLIPPADADPGPLPEFLRRPQPNETAPMIVKTGAHEAQLRRLREEKTRKAEQAGKVVIAGADATPAQLLAAGAAQAQADRKAATEPAQSAKPEEKTVKTSTAIKTPKKPAGKPTKSNARKAPAKRAAKAAKKAAAANARKGAGAELRPDGLRVGSKQAMMIDRALAPGGATEAEICKALGWKKCRVTLKRVAEKIGAALSRDPETGKYHATMPAPKKGKP